MRIRRGAFTLIELLVVIAVIAIVAAIMFPVLSRARDAARQTECLSNLRQLGVGLQMYEDDFDGRFPFAIDYWDRNTQSIWAAWDYYLPLASHNVAVLSARVADDGSPFGGQIDRVLRPWTVDEGVWRCPGDSGVGGIGAATSTTYAKALEHIPVWKISRGTGSWGGTSYVYRTELGLSFKPAARIRYPSFTQVLMDASFYWHTRLHRTARDGAGEWTDYNQGSYNMLMVDGHVKNVSQKEYEDAWYKSYDNQQGVRVWTPFD